jgi:PAS domain S-box-containing protein
VVALPDLGLQHAHKCSGVQQKAVGRAGDGSLDFDVPFGCYLAKDTQLLDLLPSVVRRALQEIEHQKWLTAAETKQARLTSQLRAERQRFADLLASVPGVLWETSGGPTTGKQRIIFVSDYVEKLLGYSVRQWLSTTNFWLSIVHPEDRRRVAREAARIFACGEGGVIKSRMIAKNEDVVWVESQIVVTRDPEGQPVGTRGGSMDITERHWNELRRNLQYVTSRALAESATHLYRIAQEAVTNAVKHGRAKEVVIRLAESEDKCILTITDDGLGLPETPAKNRGTGLRIMKYRAATIGASLKVCRAGGRGTCVSCSFFNQPRPKD